MNYLRFLATATAVYVAMGHIIGCDSRPELTCGEGTEQVGDICSVMTTDPTLSPDGGVDGSSLTTPLRIHRSELILAPDLIFCIPVRKLTAAGVIVDVDSSQLAISEGSHFLVPIDYPEVPFFADYRCEPWMLMVKGGEVGQGSVTIVEPQTGAWTRVPVQVREDSFVIHTVLLRSPQEYGYTVQQVPAGDAFKVDFLVYTNESFHPGYPIVDWRTVELDVGDPALARVKKRDDGWYFIGKKTGQVSIVGTVLAGKERKLNLELAGSHLTQDAGNVNVVAQGVATDLVIDLSSESNYRVIETDHCSEIRGDVVYHAPKEVGSVATDAYTLNKTTEIQWSIATGSGTIDQNGTGPSLCVGSAKEELILRGCYKALCREIAIVVHNAKDKNELIVNPTSLNVSKVYLDSSGPWACLPLDIAVVYEDGTKRDITLSNAVRWIALDPIDLFFGIAPAILDGKQRTDSDGNPCFSVFTDNAQGETISVHYGGASATFKLTVK